jgi:hypothetical protein
LLLKNKKGENKMSDKNIVWGFQGDCVFYFIERKNIPKDAKKLETKVLLEGETIGHKHRIVEGECDLYEKDGVLYYVPTTETKVAHEEHRTTTIINQPAIIDRPREFDHLKNMERKIID